MITLLRWGVAVAGVWYVVAHLSIRDQAWVILDPATNRPQHLTLEQPTAESAATFPVRVNGQVRNVPQNQIVNEPDVKHVAIRSPDGSVTRVSLLGVQTNGETVVRYLVADRDDSPARWVAGSDVVGYVPPHPYPHPREQMGLERMVRQASPGLLWAALLVFPITFVVTSYRWHELLKVLDIDLSFRRAFALNMVGSFWNTCIPGSTGGDVIKAVQVSKLTPHRTRAVMSVLIDRAVGLLALIILGGTVASFQWHVRACRDVALGSGALIACTALGMLVFYNPTLHRVSGLDAIPAPAAPAEAGARGGRHDAALSRPPAAVAVDLGRVVPGPRDSRDLGDVGGHGVRAAAALALLLGVRAGDRAGGGDPDQLPGRGGHGVLGGAAHAQPGVTVSQAVALAMSVRVVQIVWNLSGGIFVLGGGYHSPTAAEQAEVDAAGADALPGGPTEPAIAV